jgi:hypothetical protein
VILISPSPASLQQVRRELLNRSVTIEAEFTSVSNVTNALRKAPNEKRVLILQMGSSGELTELGRLKTLFPGWPVVALVDGYDPKSSLGEVVIGIMRAGASTRPSTGSPSISSTRSGRRR